MTPLDHALRYAALGWPVFPIWPMRNGACGCSGLDNCTPGKHPITSHGFKGASTDPADIRRWWGKNPDANVGLWCEGAGLAVADVDPRNGGDVSWAALDIPDSLLVANTGGGGKHHFYRAPKGDWYAALHDGIDVKFRGYVILAPSNHESGGTYSWQGIDPETAIGLLGELPALPACFIDTTPRDISASQERCGDLTLDDAQHWMSLLDPAEYRDGPHDPWVNLGMALQHEFGDDGYDLWVEYSRPYAKFNERELRLKWRSFRSGKSKVVTFRSIIDAAAAHRGAENVARLLNSFDEEDDEDLGTPPARAAVDPIDILGTDASESEDSKPDDIDPIDAIGAAAAGETEAVVPAHAKEWMNLLQFTDKGAINQTLHNVRLIMVNDPRIQGVPQINEFTLETVQRRKPGTMAPRRRNAAKQAVQLKGRIWDVRDLVNGDIWTDEKDFAVRAVFEAPTSQGGYGIKVSDRDLKSATVLAACESSFHPIKEYLEKLTWDGIRRVETLWVDYLGTPDNSYYRDTARLTLVAAVCRLYEPGHKFDFSPIIEGGQGKRKSTFINRLGLRWAHELDGDFHDTKQMIELMQGVWILELPELTGFVRSDIRAIKAFMSRTVDRARLAYAKRATNFPRQCIFIGSTNDREYLKDDTGGRRFWPIECLISHIDIDRLTENVDQLWAEALHIYRQMRAKQPHDVLPLYLMSGESQRYAARLQESRRQESADDALAGQIAGWLERPVNSGGFDDDDTGPTRYRNVTCKLEIWMECLGGQRVGYNQQVAQNIGRAMNRLDDWFVPTDEEAGAFHSFQAPYGRQRCYRRSYRGEAFTDILG